MEKRYSILFNIILLCWFSLDMIGIYFGKTYLVTSSYKEDGVFMLIYFISFLLFIFKDKIGKYILCIWLFIWWIAQFMSHWYYTIFGGGQGVAVFFKDSIKLFEVPNRYIPDLYHIILHIFILSALFFTVKFTIYTQKNQRTK